jgi:hypothetical protein
MVVMIFTDHGPQAIHWSILPAELPVIVEEQKTNIPRHMNHLFMFETSAEAMLSEKPLRRETP